MGYPQGELQTGERDVLLDEVGGCPVWIGGARLEPRKHTPLVLDAVPCPGAGSSLAGPIAERALKPSVPSLPETRPCRRRS
jgi:uncharacterized protein (DUF779 family)